MNILIDYSFLLFYSFTLKTRERAENQRQTQEDLEENYPGGTGRIGDGVGTNGGESLEQNGLEDVCAISPMLK